MLPPINLPWHDPRCYAAGISENESHWILLYSGQHYPHTGQRSYLGLSKKEEVRSRFFSDLAAKLSCDQSQYDNAWFGCLGYELRHDVERLPFNNKAIISVPPLWMVSFHVVMVFDHIAESVELWLSDNMYRDAVPIPQPIAAEYPAPNVETLCAAMNRDTYLANVSKVLDHIQNGDIYQANLTRKFHGVLALGRPFELYLRLSKVSPAPYSAFLKFDDICILSSSPERFLTVDAEGHVESRPIKGTARRGKDENEDAEIITGLSKSEKDRAENLMIVDLMRNDLSRNCVPDSVKVSGLFEVTTYATLHHMASTVSGLKQPQVKVLDVVKGCFPPGSMTGAPKIRAMEICSGLESHERGLYSGAIGWFGGDGSCDLSVVIRTILLQSVPNKPRHYTYEFQVGGAIVADSTPENEWQETRTKARGILAALGVSEERLQ